ncbi:MAG: RagB/SusD family nutrient uptake outer membrane protein, partial [Mucilaginibacter sp.]
MKIRNLLIITLLLATGCRKDWLDAKPNKALVIPQTLADYQALLDNPSMNTNQPSMSMVGDGDYGITDANYTALGYPPEKGAYTWAATEDFYGGQANYEWISAYARILQTNIVLDGLSGQNNNVTASALFFRSYNYYELAQQYCKAYDAATAGSDLGLPLRLSANVNLNVSRSTLQATYEQLTGDVLKALPLLPVKPLFPTRPSKPAAYGLLARIYLSQENYGQALLYADSCLQLQNGLMDFNTLSLTAATPIAYFNQEVIFHSQLTSYQSGNPP